MPSDDVTISIGTTGVDKSIKDVERLNTALDKVDQKKITPAVEVGAAFAQLRKTTTETVRLGAAARALQDEFGKALDPAGAVELAETLARMDVSLDTMINHADLVGQEMRKLSQDSGLSLEQLVGPGAAAEALSAGFEQASSTISGVIGETTGELLNMGGVAEAITIPISNVAESIAEMALEAGKSGTGVGALLTGLGQAAGPIAAVSVAVGIATHAWEEYKKRQEEVAQTTAAAAEALGDITGVTAALNRELEQLGTGPAADFGDQLLASVVKAHPEFATLIADANKLGVSTKDLGDILAGLGEKGSLGGKQVEIDSLQQSLGVSERQANGLRLALEAGTGSWEDFVFNAGIFANMTEAQLEPLKEQLGLWLDIANARKDADLNKVAGEQLALMEATTEGLKRASAARIALAEQGFTEPTDLQVMTQIGAVVEDVTDKVQEQATAMREWRLENRDIGKELPKQWAIAKVAADKYRRGVELTATEQQTLNALASQMGTDVVGVLNQAAAAWDADRDAMNENAEAAQKATEARNKALQEQEEENRRLVVSMEDTQAALDEMGGAFNVMKDSGDALKGAFALGNAPVDFLSRVRDINDGMRDFSDFINDPKKGLGGRIPDIFDPNDVNAGEFLQEIRKLRDPIQEEIENSFAVDGAPGAKKTAEQYVNQLFQVLRGKLSKDEIRSLLALGDIEMRIGIALDSKSKAQFLKELDLLVGLQGGESPFTASINLAVEAKQLSPEAAKILIERQLGQKGVEVPASVATPDVGKAKEEADRFAKGHPVNMLSNIDMTSTEVMIARNIGQEFADDVDPITFPSAIAPPTTPIKIPVEPVFKSGKLFLRDAGGTVPTGGIGLVAERRPEIINERYLATQPTLVPAGTRVTSGARTARILRTRGTRGLKRYDAGGTVAAGAPNISINFNGVGAIGNRYDLMRTVQRAALDKVRLLGNR